MTNKLDEHSPSERLHLLVPQSLLDRVHRWRRRCEEPPTIARAVRLLLERGLDEEGVPRDRAAPDPGPQPDGIGERKSQV